MCTFINSSEAEILSTSSHMLVVPSRVSPSTQGGQRWQIHPHSSLWPFPAAPCLAPGGAKRTRAGLGDGHPLWQAGSAPPWHSGKLQSSKFKVQSSITAYSKLLHLLYVPHLATLEHTVCTSLLQLAQRRAEWMSVLTRQQAAGERLRSGEGSVLRPSGIPSE